MEILIGADYRGFEKKNQLRDFLVAQGYRVEDQGAYEYTEGDDFNDPVIAVAKGVKSRPNARGILICDSAHGVTIQANRFKGIRAAHANSITSAQLAREHDDANILCLSAHSMPLEEMEKIATTFLKTDFVQLERRARRIKRLDERKDYD